MPDPPPPRRAAGLLILTRRPPRQFLLLRHADRWDLPKGHCDPGESDLQTALRETQEETGLAPEQIRVDPNFRYELSYPVQYDPPDGERFQKHVVYLLGEVEAPFTPELTEHLSHRWFPWQPPQRIQAQTIDPLLAAVHRHRSKRAGQ
jgi:8-oxo-dGTP pyrophosphatase MutT (NUDIX family)